VPDEIKGWNFGAFFLNWIWGIGNQTYIAFLAFVPVVGFFITFFLGVKGNELAWRNKKWESIEEFKRVQRQWTKWAWITICGILLFVAGLIFVVFSMTSSQVKVVDEFFADISRKDIDAAYSLVVPDQFTKDAFASLVKQHPKYAQVKKTSFPDRSVIGSDATIKGKATLSDGSEFPITIEESNLNGSWKIQSITGLSEPGNNVFEDKSLGFEIEYPQDWIQSKDIQKESGAVNIWFKSQELKSSQASVVIQIVEDNGTVDSVAVKTIVDEIKSSLTGNETAKSYDEKDFIYTFSDGSTTIGKQFKNEFTKNDTTMSKQWIALVPYGERIYLFVYSTNKEDYDANFPYAKMMLDSWKITKIQGVAGPSKPVMNVFKVDGFGYEINYPQDWIQSKETDQETGDVTVLFENQKAGDSPSNVSINVFDFGKTIDLVELKALTDEVKKSYTGKKERFLDEKDFVYAFADGSVIIGRQFKIEATEQGTRAKQWFVYIPYGKKVYAFMYTARIENYDADLPNAEMMLDSWKIAK